MEKNKMYLQTLRTMKYTQLVYLITEKTNLLTIALKFKLL